MLNFREELNKIKEEKMKSRVEKSSERCLNGILNYLKTKRKEEFKKKFKLMLMFEIIENKIFVKENPRTNEKEICSFSFNSYKMAREVLYYIEFKLRDEHFEIVSSAAFTQSDKFCVEINV